MYTRWLVGPMKAERGRIVDICLRVLELSQVETDRAASYTLPDVTKLVLLIANTGRYVRTVHVQGG